MTPQFDPVAEPTAVIQRHNARFTLLTSRLIRLEYAPDGRFEDRPSQTFWYRRQPAPVYNLIEQEGWLTVETDYLQLRYELERPFSPDSLQIKLKQTGRLWRYGDVDKENLGGTTRTLDMVSGDTRLESGLLSRAGWALVDDSASLVFNAASWIEPRRAQPGYQDLYFFGYGRDYKQCLIDYTKIAGAVPLLPRYVLGNWWSRYWAYSQAELMSLMRDFRAHEIPLAVCIVDMDWHREGWTGYSWNYDLFPEPDAFIEWLHEQGLRTALNLHPADGVGPHEDAYPAMAERMGQDPATKQPIPFQLADPHFARAYFELLHHPLEEMGVDFWWLDWQQGHDSGLAGLDPLYWLNHLHFYDLGRDGRKRLGRKRPFIFSRWGGLSGHRYPIGFSGDTYADWPSFAFQPYFTATAANVNFGWWSHDIGGHQRGVSDPELYTRWLQFGVFSPIMRLHSTKSPFQERRPWGYDANVFQAAQAALQLRHALIPYLYTLSWQNAQTGVPPFRPLYHDYPDQEEAYHCPQAYTLGDQLIAAPFTSPADPDTNLSRQVVWLPPGDWYNFFSGEYFPGNSWHAVYGRLTDIPVFARAGAIVPLGPRAGWGGVDNPDELHLHLFSGADGEFVLYEDDGVNLAYQDGRYAQTRFSQQARENGLTVAIEPARGDLSIIPSRRQYHLTIYGVREPEDVSPLLNGQPWPIITQYNPQKERLVLAPLTLASTDSFSIEIRHSDGLAARRDRTAETVSDMLWAFKLEIDAKAAIAAALDNICADPDYLAPFQVALSESQLRALLETTRQAGCHHLPQGVGREEKLILWNNRQEEKLRLWTAVWRDNIWDVTRQFPASGGVIPRSLVAAVPSHRWQINLHYGPEITLAYPGS
jgi:alpha-glucosidase (family GH31 glycosyl hydrolase)